MSLAVITDSSVNLPAEIQGHADVYVLDIPVIIEGQPFVEGKNLDVNQFYAQMANSEELLKTSQPNLADLDNLLMEFEEKGYTHVVGLFLSSGISGFVHTLHGLTDEIPGVALYPYDSPCQVEDCFS